jgi:hypothetical protein
MFRPILTKFGFFMTEFRKRPELLNGTKIPYVVKSRSYATKNGRKDRHDSTNGFHGQPGGRRTALSEPLRALDASLFDHVSSS